MEKVPFLNLEYIYQLIYDLLARAYHGSLLEAILDFIARLAPLSAILCALLIWGIMYCLVRIGQIEEAEHEKMHAVHATFRVDTNTNPRWQKILDHIASESESEWRLAILEADIILGEILDRMGYHGESIADRLKQIEESDFPRLQDAWEAHKARNRIAHEGTTFELTHREAKRIISLYQAVFIDVKFI